jgi:tripartite-type tricarboxylate transporter receptor subunit TctC
MVEAHRIGVHTPEQWEVERRAKLEAFLHAERAPLPNMPDVPTQADHGIQILSGSSRSRVGEFGGRRAVPGPI